MRSSRDAFTMIELIFVIVVLGILAAVAIPKFAATREDAQISKGAADIATIRSGIVSVRQKYLLRGQTGYINTLSSGGGKYFDGNGTSGTEILMYPVVPKASGGHWTGAAGLGTGTETYNYLVGSTVCKFTYTKVDGKFMLTSTVSGNADYCNALVGE